MHIPPKTEKRSLLRNLLSNQAGFIVSVVSSFFLSPYIVRSLGDALYGIWSLIMSFTGHYSLLASGIQGATTRYIAYAVEEENYGTMNSYINSALWILMPLVALCIFTGSLIALFIGKIFTIETDYLFRAQIASLIVSMTIAVTFASVIFHCILAAYQRFDSLNIVRTSAIVVQAFLTVLLLSNGYKIIGLALMSCGIAVVSGVLFGVFAIGQCPHWKIASGYASRQAFKTLLQYGSKASIGHVALALIYQCDLVVIGLVLPLEQITMYNLGATLLLYIVQFNNTIVAVFGPYATRLYSRGGMDALRPFYLQASRLIYMLAGVAIAGCFSFGDAFFRLWIDPEHVESAVILRILILPQFFGMGARFGYCVLIATTQIGRFNLMAVIAGIANLVLSLILVQFWGIRGVAVGTLIPLVVIDGLWFIPHIARITGVSTLQIYFSSVGPGFLIMLIATTLGVAITRLLPPDSWTLLFSDIFIMLFSSGLCAFFLVPGKIGETSWKQNFIQKIPFAKRG